MKIKKAVFEVMVNGSKLVLNPETKEPEITDCRTILSTVKSPSRIYAENKFHKEHGKDAIVRNVSVFKTIYEMELDKFIQEARITGNLVREDI